MNADEHDIKNEDGKKLYNLHQLRDTWMYIP